MAITTADAVTVSDSMIANGIPQWSYVTRFQCNGKDEIVYWRHDPGYASASPSLHSEFVSEYPGVRAVFRVDGRPAPIRALLKKHAHTDAATGMDMRPVPHWAGPVTARYQGEWDVWSCSKFGPDLDLEAEGFPYYSGVYAPVTTPGGFEIDDQYAIIPGGEGGYAGSSGSGAQAQAIMLIPCWIEHPMLDSDGDYDPSLGSMHRILSAIEAQDLAGEWGIIPGTKGLDALSDLMAEDFENLAIGTGDLTTDGLSPWSADGPKKGADIDMETLAKRTRFKEQCYLLANIEQFATFNMRTDPSYEWTKNNQTLRRKAITVVQGESNQVVNKLTQNGVQQHFFSLTPDQLSLLTPRLQLFKIVTDMPIGGSQGARGCERAIPIPFYSGQIGHHPIYADEDSIEEMVWDNEWSRGAAGIKKFEWSYVGNNPVAARTDINAKLVLFFQNFEDIIRHRNIPGGGGTFSYAELALRTGDQLMEEDSDPVRTIIPYRLRAHVGWNLADAAKYTEPDAQQNMGITFTPEQIAAIEQQYVTLYLTIVDHSFDLRDDATVEFTIEYKAYIEAVFGDPGKADILLTADLAAARYERAERVAIARAECNDEEIGDLREAHQREIEVEKQEAYESILMALSNPAGYLAGAGDNESATRLAAGDIRDGNGVEQTLRNSRIYTLEVPRHVLDMFVNIGPLQYDNDGGWLAQQLSGPGGGAPSGGGASPGSTMPQTNLNILDEIKGRIQWQENGSTDVDTALENLTLINMTNANLSTASKLDSVLMHYFYFGDLIHVGLEKLEATAQLRVDGAHAYELDMVYKSRLILGPIDLLHPVTGERFQVNLADVPVSVNYFVEWFLSKILAKREVQWSLLSFIREAVNDLIIRVMNDGEFCFGGTVKQKAHFNSTFLIGRGHIDDAHYSGHYGSSPSTGATERYYRCPIDLWEKRQYAPMGGIGFELPGVPMPEYRVYTQLITETNVANYSDLSWPLLASTADDDMDNYCDDPYFKYVLITANSTFSSELTGDRPADMDKGVFWYNIGAPRGPIKTVKFSKTDMRGVKEARFYREGFDGLAQLREPYDVDIETYGMPRTFPGTMCFVDPIGLGVGLGSPSDPSSYAFLLGFGGYHQIVRVNNVIEPGKFFTKIHAKWVQSGNEADHRRGHLIGSSETSSECPKVISDYLGAANAGPVGGTGPIGQPNVSPAPGGGGPLATGHGPVPTP
jgi:hypothetical protein